MRRYQSMLGSRARVRSHLPLALAMGPLPSSGGGPALRQSSTAAGRRGGLSQRRPGGQARLQRHRRPGGQAQQQPDGQARLQRHRRREREKDLGGAVRSVPPPVSLPSPAISLCGGFFTCMRAQHSKPWDWIWRAEIHAMLHCNIVTQCH